MSDMESWDTWGKHIIEEQKRLHHMQVTTLSLLNKIHIELATLKVKASIWGATAGMIPIVVVLAIKLIHI